MDVLTNNLAKDAGLMEEVTSGGCESWCTLDSYPQQLSQSLGYLSSSRALPNAAISAAEHAFSLAQVTCCHLLGGTACSKCIPMGMPHWYCNANHTLCLQLMVKHGSSSAVVHSHVCPTCGEHVATT